jgi:glutathione synthase/RimK-type ligase-like ATP-grasp enzyme
MTPNGRVLIVSTIADVATDEIVLRLTALGVSHRRLNTEDYPFASTLTFCPAMNGEKSQFLADGNSLDGPTSIWYRRMRTPSKPDGMDEGVYTFCLQENRAVLLGSLLSLNARWMSHPTAVWRAEFKPFQLSSAVECGLRIPRTLVTNDPSAIRSAFARLDGMIVKPARSGFIVNEGREFSIYTSKLLEEHLAELDDARWSPAIYQELVPKRFDIRVTIVGERLFAVAIDSQSDPAATIDWRQTTNPQLPHHAISLPESVRARLLAMMERLDLSFGAIDMVQTPEGEYVFLEVNPSGQWLWLDDKLHLGISDAVASWLANTVTP